MNGGRLSMMQLFAIAIVVVLIVMVDRALFRGLDLDVACQQRASSGDGYRYDHKKYPTQVVPAVAPALVGWNGTREQKRILITGGAGFIGCAKQIGL